MADPRGLQINRNIFDFEERIYILSDKMPKTFRYSVLHQKLIEHTLEMRHYTYLACSASKWDKKEKVTLFGMAAGYAADVATGLEHEYNRRWLTDRDKANLDLMLDGIRVELAKLISALSKDVDRHQSARSA